MTARAVAALLHRAWLLAGTLAVIAGLLGMHVLASGHASHGAVSERAAAGHAVVAHSVGGDHSAQAGHHSAATAPDAPVPGSAGCGGSCPAAQEQGTPCVPSVPGGPVTVSPPQATLAVLPGLPAAGGPGYGYSYLPPSPTPCELSISRT
ncbi:hypothetical protein NG819_07330 [Pseudarthrobacter sp. Fe7]|nr:hypothetical protein NG819_07330 [Pseudarthrobacter sp. Fe7]